MTPEDLEQIRAITREEITTRLDRAVESIADDFSELRQDMIRRFDKVDQRFDRVDQRFDSIDRRLERLENQNHTLALQSIGMSKSLTDAERLDSATAATLSAQQKAIDELYHQIAELKRQLPKQ